MNDRRTIAYFSMEIGLEADIPTYSGGLGVLAGDTIRAAADLKLPMVAISLLYHKGYFCQTIDEQGWQQEQPVTWQPEAALELCPDRCQVQVEGRDVRLQVWRYDVTGVTGHVVPVYLLDARLPENATADQCLTDYLYGGDQHYRLCQEALLGIGGVRMLRAMGYREIDRFHMNEGHASLLTLELLDECASAQGRPGEIRREDVDRVRRRCVFTTHTPVPAGHDQFPMPLVQQVLGRREIERMKDVFCCDGILNMTHLALNLSHYVNGVAKSHRAVSQSMFSHYVIDAITNGVHVGTWTSAPFQELFDKYITDWRVDNFALRSALGIPRSEILSAHAICKKTLIDHVRRESGVALGPEIFTLGFARRAANYKRADLLFSDTERLKKIARQNGGLQIIYAGKAHPADADGKELIQRVIEHGKSLGPEVKMVYLADYDMALAGLMTAGVDVWLNTPEPPLEASGTSGMKAALNGVPSLSILDGWWVEGCIEGETGWSIGNPWKLGGCHEKDCVDDAQSLYDKLEHAILPLYSRNRAEFRDIRRHCIALNGSFFNTQRMIQQYVLKAYFE